MNRTDDYRVVTLDMPDWVTVVARRRDGRFVLIRQLRYGTNAVTLETPGGIVDPDESPRTAAARELLEETGYRSRHWRSLGWVHPNPAIQGNRLHMFLALDAEPSSMPSPEDGEAVTVRLLPPIGLTRALDRGRIHHALSALALERGRRALGL